MTMRESVERAPKRSPIHPPGNSNSAYASQNAPMISPSCPRERCSSARIGSTARLMQTRSKYVRNASVPRNSITTKRLLVGRPLLIRCGANPTEGAGESEEVSREIRLGVAQDFQDRAALFGRDLLEV